MSTNRIEDCMMEEKVLVTGGAGFVASWCIAQLLERGYEVRTTVRDLSRETALRSALQTVTNNTDALTLVKADLTRDAGWDAAMSGCDYVLHVASPLGGVGNKDPNSFIGPARDGTLRVLRAAVNAKVKRFVMTSAATTATPKLRGPNSLSDESVWGDVNETDVGAYRQSKRFAEQAAWKFVRENGFEASFTAVLPGAVFGPLLMRDNIGSVQIIDRLLQGKMPGNPRLGFEVIDVRDLADLHIRAMTMPQATGERFLGVGEFMWMREISSTLRGALGEAANKVPTRNLPDIVLKTLSLVNPALREITPSLGREHRHSTDKARRLLGWVPRPARSTIVDCAHSLLALRPSVA
jgi:nucleoside-diphosphate-sugar epimerase